MSEPSAALAAPAPEPVDNFDDAVARARLRKSANQANLSQIRKRRGGIKQFKKDIAVEPLASEQERALFEKLWARVPAEKFQDENYTIREALRDYGEDLVDEFRTAGLIMKDGDPVDRFARRVDEYHGKIASLFTDPDEVGPVDTYFSIPSKSNFDRALMDEIGPYRDYSIMLRHPETGEIIGGVDFVVYAHKEGVPTVHTNFIFTDPKFSGIGLMDQLLKIQDEAVLKFLEEKRPEALEQHGGFLRFGEVDEPHLMDPYYYAQNMASLTDPLDRLAAVGAHGYAPLRFNYTQPALDEGGEPVTSMRYHASFRNVVKKKGGFTLGAEQTPKGVMVSVLIKHFNALFKQNIVPVEGDTSVDQMMSQLKPLAEENKYIPTISAENRKDYVKTWRQRIGTIIKRMKGRELTENRTIGEIWHNRGKLGLGWMHLHRPRGPV